MPLNSPKRKISDTENKLRVLSCLDALGMATLDELWPFSAQLEMMEYVPFCVFVDELQSDGAIASGHHALEGVLYLTAAGKQQLSLFSDKILHADRERIAASAPAYREKLRARKQVRSAYELAADGLYAASLTMREGDVPTLFIRIETSEATLVHKAVRSFQYCVSQVLSLLYTIDLAPSDTPMPRALSQEAALAASAQGQPALCAFGGREHAAVVRIGDDATQYTVMLLLPDAATAWQWALSAGRENLTLSAALSAMFASAEADA